MGKSAGGRNARDRYRSLAPDSRNKREDISRHHIYITLIMFTPCHRVRTHTDCTHLACRLCTYPSQYNIPHALTVCTISRSARSLDTDSRCVHRCSSGQKGMIASALVGNTVECNRASRPAPSEGGSKAVVRPQHLMAWARSRD